MSKRAADNDSFEIEAEQIDETVSAFNVKFQETVDSRVFSVRHSLKNFKGDLNEVREKIDACFMKMVTPAIESAGEKDFVQFAIKSDVFQKSNREFGLFFKKKSDISPQCFLDKLRLLAQSGEGRAIFDSPLKIVTRIIRNVSGGVRPQHLNRFDDRYNKKRCLIQIRSNGYDCGYKAIALGKWMLDFPVEAKIKSRRDEMTKDRGQNNNNGHSLLTVHGRNLCSSSSISYHSPMGLDEIQKIEETIKDYQIIVFFRPQNDDEVKRPNVFYKGPIRKKKIHLELVRSDSSIGHYNFIKDPHQYFDCRYFCYACLCGHSNLSKHNCDGICIKCKSDTKCSANTNSVHCDICDDNFYGENCFLRHKSNFCDNKENNICDVCQVTYSKRSSHICGMYVCQRCYASFKGEQGKLTVG